MKKRLIMLLLFYFLIVFCATGLDKSILTDVNIYGGKTIKYVLSPLDKYGDQIQVSYYLYNAINDLKEVIHEFTDLKADNFGFKNQREKYENGSITEYKLELTDKEKEIQGISWQIDKVDSEGNIYMFEYSDGLNIARSNSQSFVVNYPFYTLPYLEEVLFESYEENENGDVNTLSAKYWRARTFIEFVSDPVSVDEIDKGKIHLYLSRFNQQENTNVYSHKIEIEYRKKKYICYLQNSFVEYITKNDKCLLTYQFMGINKELVILATEFDEIE